MTVVLSYDQLELTVNTHGAEMTRLYNKTSGLEYLCEKEKPVWQEQAPILFPIIGNLKEGYYLYQGKKYFCNTHGFAKNSEFSILEKTDNSVSLVLCNTPSTAESFPFEFSLKITYTICDASVCVMSEITNKGQETLICSLGFHPGFRCPLANKKEASDYRISFKTPFSASRIIMENGLIFSIEQNGWTKDSVPVSEDLFSDGVIGLTDLNTKTVRLWCENNPHFVELEFEDYPVLALWAPSTEPITYVCIEPRYGLQDFADCNNDLTQKKGCMTISPLSSIKLQYIIRTK